MTVSDRVADAPTVLVIDSTDESSVCRELVEADVSAGREVLWVCHERSACEAVGTIDETDTAGVLSVGGLPGEADAVGDVHVESVSKPGDLPALGLKLSRLLSEHDGELTICFESITALLEHADRNGVCRFLHTLTAQIREAGARAHFHLAPDHDVETTGTVASLCDALVDPDTEPTVRTRPPTERPDS
ncbi:DUF7504 family protein [Halomicrobium salinisoli]|uniref:DUF7504 family protein n=1 Tax=Halomicrobium salinisoli TaxID=2878391 RepID=UPI001CF02AB7|nr:hypothetical protein [Halomicrobium salinisoli]